MEGRGSHPSAKRQGGGRSSGRADASGLTPRPCPGQASVPMGPAVRVGPRQGPSSPESGGAPEGLRENGRTVRVIARGDRGHGMAELVGQRRTEGFLPGAKRSLNSLHVRRKARAATPGDLQRPVQLERERLVCPRGQRVARRLPWLRGRPARVNEPTLGRHPGVETWGPRRASPAPADTRHEEKHHEPAAEDHEGPKRSPPIPCMLCCEVEGAHTKPVLRTDPSVKPRARLPPRHAWSATRPRSGRTSASGTGRPPSGRRHRRGLPAGAPCPPWAPATPAPSR